MCQPPVQLQMNDDSRENEQKQRSTRLLLLQQRVVGPALGDNTLAQDDDDVALLNSGEAMGDNDGGALAGVRGNHRVDTLLKKRQA